MKNLKKYWKIGVLLMLILLVFYVITLREIYRTTRQVLLNNGDFIKINHEYSDKKVWVDWREVLTIGGGDPISRCWFEYKNYKYSFRYKYSNLILLNNYKEDLFVVFLDVDSDIECMKFKYYKLSEGKETEINSTLFPKSIAVQNLGLSSNSGYFQGEIIDGIKMVKELNCAYPPFQGSLTAKLWLELERGIMLCKSPSHVDEEFLSDFKNKYIMEKTEAPTAVK